MRIPDFRPWARGRGKRTPILARPPPGAEMNTVRARDNGEVVRAWRAERTGEIETGRGALHYVSGRDWILQRGPHDYTVVRGDLFPRLYRLVRSDRYARRTDVVFRYFTLSFAVRVRTPEGLQNAEPGDWIMCGLDGALWHMTSKQGAAAYERAD